MSILKKIKGRLYPICQRCKKRYLAPFNMSTNLQKLKQLNEYKPEYDNFKRLCISCWKKIRRTQCGLCGGNFNVIVDKKITLVEHFKKYKMISQEIIDAKHICITCFYQHQLTECAHCQKPFRLKENMGIAYLYNNEVKKWLYPYSPFYLSLSDRDGLCLDCYKLCEVAYQDVQNNIKNCAGGTKT